MIIILTCFEKTKEGGKLLFDNTTFVSKQFMGMIKSFAFLPKFYGTETLSQEGGKVIKTAITIKPCM